MPDSTALVALLGVTGVVSASVIGPYVNSRLAGRQRVLEADQARKIRAAEKAEDYARQDEVARRTEEVATKAAEAAELLLSQQTAIRKQAEEAARLLVASDAHADHVAQDLKQRVAQVHELVNSNMTESLVDQLAANERALELARRLEAYADTPELHVQMTDLQRAIVVLRAKLADRAVQLDRADEARKTEV